MATDSEQNAAFHDKLAAHYDSHLTRPQDLLARAAFQGLVSRHVPAGSTVLDFGCGTGIDALEYAQRGYRVLAYDNSRRHGGGIRAALRPGSRRRKGSAVLNGLRGVPPSLARLAEARRRDCELRRFEFHSRFTATV